MTSTNASRVAEKIKALREERGWSQRELARRMDVVPPAIHRIENSTGNLRVQTVQRLARAFQVEASVFLQASTPPLEKGVPEEREAPLRDASELAKKIRELREERGWSQRELARRLNMDPAALNRIENGTGNLHLQTIHRFANVFEIDANVFLEALASSHVQRADTAKDGEVPSADVDEEDPDSLVGERVRSIRKLKGMTLKDLSEKVGISLAYLGEMERGKSPWKLSVLSKIAKVLNLPLTLLQDPLIRLDRLQRVASILDHLAELPEEQLAAMEHLLNSLNPS